MEEEIEHLFMEIWDVVEEIAPAKSLNELALNLVRVMLDNGHDISESKELMSNKYIAKAIKTYHVDDDEDEDEDY